MFRHHQACSIHVQGVYDPDALDGTGTRQLQVFPKALSREPSFGSCSPALRVSAEAEAGLASLTRSKFVSSLPSLSSGITMLAFSLSDQKQRITTNFNSTRKTDPNTLVPLSQRSDCMQFNTNCKPDRKCSLLACQIVGLDAILSFSIVSTFSI